MAATATSSLPARPPPTTQPIPSKWPSKRRQKSDVSLIARFQTVLFVASITIWLGTWYMISKAELAISSTTQQHHRTSSFFDQASSDCSFSSSAKSYATAVIGGNNSPSSSLNKKQLLRRIQSTDELTRPYHLLTIAIDSRHSCPDLCTFVHPLLPSWVRYRQVHFESEVDLAEKLKDERGHIVVVARTNIINIANWAVERRQSNNSTSSSTGLFHNADERFHKGEIAGVYDKFDYVLRQYYRRDDDGKFHGYVLHALGNHTCGTTRQSLPVPSEEGETAGPRWGVHYVPLNAHTVDVQLLHHPTANYPTSLRSNNCSFIGRGDVKRSLHERAAMKTAVEEHGLEMNCTVTFTGSFASGNTKFEYLNYDIGNAKIGLCPRGSAIETHRLAELLRMGTVPAIVAEDYLYATFRSVPGIIGKDWPAVVQSMKGYLAEERELLAENERNGAPSVATAAGGRAGGGARISKLEMLSREGTKWFADMEACMMADMDYILRGAFGLLPA